MDVKPLTPAELKRLRERRLKMSQGEFATTVGVDSVTVSRWERGVLAIKPQVAQHIRMIVGSGIKGSGIVKHRPRGSKNKTTAKKATAKKPAA